MDGEGCFRAVFDLTGWRILGIEWNLEESRRKIIFGG
jgi:hypothetical protein